MAGGLHFDSIADLPEKMRQQVAGKIMASHLVAGAEKETPAQESEKKTSKYRNMKTEVNGITFDSVKEARRYQQLMLAVEMGVISDLRLQVDFTLQEAYTTANGQRIQAIRYRADFTYKVVSPGYDRMAILGYEDIEYWRSLWPGALVVEDVKSRGTKTRVYLNKKKMMADKGYTIREV